MILCSPITCFIVPRTIRAGGIGCEGWATSIRASWRAEPREPRRLSRPSMPRPDQHSDEHDRFGYLAGKRKAPCGAGEGAGAGMRCPITARNSQSSQARPPAAHRPARTDEDAGYSAQRSPDPICQGSEKARRTWVRLRADPSASRDRAAFPADVPLVIKICASLPPWGRKSEKRVAAWEAESRTQPCDARRQSERVALLAWI